MPVRRKNAARTSSPEDRDLLYYEVASLYHEQGLTQAQIARRLGRTRSMVSRLLTEAVRRKIVEIRVHKPRLRDAALEEALCRAFSLHGAWVAKAGEGESAETVRRSVGDGGAQVLAGALSRNSVLGVGWGTSVAAVVQRLPTGESLSLKVVQLVAALGARNLDFDGHATVRQVVERLGGEGYYLNAPFMVETPGIVRELLRNPSVRETVELYRRCNVALSGMGSTDARFSSYYQAGYVPIAELEDLRSTGAVGDVCGHHFDIHGQAVASKFDERLVAIGLQELLDIPVRIGVASGTGKAAAILGALRARYLTTLVTDSLTATRVLGLAESAAEAAAEPAAGQATTNRDTRTGR